MNPQELLYVVDAVAKEKDLDTEDIFKTIEESILILAKEKYGEKTLLQTIIDRKVGNIILKRSVKVVNEVSNPFLEIHIDEAKKITPQAEIEQDIQEILPNIEFDRTAAATMRSHLTERIREIERHKQFEEYKDRIGDMFSLTVKRVEFGNIIADVGRAEGILRKEDMIAKETFRVGDRFKAVVTGLKIEGTGPLVSLSRTHSMLVSKMFYSEIPEVYDGLIEIKAVARDPGSRAKVAVYSRDKTLDLITACVGIRGSRVQIMTSELKGERIDVIPWSSDLVTFIVNSLAPAEVARVIIGEDEKKVQVVVSNANLSLAIGRRGQNVRLASILTGTHIDLLTEEIDQQRRAKEKAEKCDLFMNALDVDEMFAQFLIAEGFHTIDDILDTNDKEFSQIQGLDEGLVQELKTRARDYLKRQQEEILEDCAIMGMQEDLLRSELLDPRDLQKLASESIKTGCNLADLASDELAKILSIDEDKAGNIIMLARKKWMYI
jgi:N utilization substance protein A